MKADVTVLSRSELEAAILGFTEAQWIRLHKVAKKYAWLYLGDPDDLVSEAMMRALSGGRKCPVNIDPVTFLAEAMRSIADGEANKVENQVDVLPIVQPGNAIEQAVDPISLEPNAEERMEAAQNTALLRQAMFDLFPDDQQARDLLDGIMEGFEGQELQELTGLLDATAFASKRKLVRRTIDKHYPAGWTP